MSKIDDNLSEILNIEPHNVDAHVSRAIELISLKQYTQAITSLDIALEIDPNSILCAKCAHHFLHFCSTCSNS